MRRRVDQPQRIRVMGRLPSLSAWSALGWLAATASALSCRDDASQAAARAASRERSEVVAAKGGEPEAKTPTPAAVVSAAPASAQPRKVCDGQLGKAGRDLTKKPLARKFAPGAKAPMPT